MTDQDPTDPTDPTSGPGGEQQAADALDAEIDALLAGRPDPSTTPAVLLLHAAARTDPPAGLGGRIEHRRERELRRRWRPMRYAAAVMAYLFFSQGVGNLLWGDWVADGVGDAYSPHLTREGGLALMAVGVAVGLGALHRRMATVAAAAGVPLGIAFGIAGIGEVGVFAAGAALHLTQGVVAVVLAVTFWRFRRDTSGDPDEEGA